MAIMAAIADEIRRRRHLIDENASLQSITFKVSLQDGNEMVRSTSVEEVSRNAGRNAGRR